MKIQKINEFYFIEDDEDNMNSHLPKISGDETLKYLLEKYSFSEILDAISKIYENNGENSASVEVRK